MQVEAFPVRPGKGQPGSWPQSSGSRRNRMKVGNGGRSLGGGRFQGSGSGFLQLPNRPHKADGGSHPLRLLKRKEREE